ncbi:NACHT, LRR and PYD domains-containing protein 1b allele 2-like [Leptodactylus fuscus]|uniref:NACHT, LRR and PYD domains-containing protein 1b allele 2-like n=1 Tax=Leptodactylus fuscus TaxID=238119 RepID=UPI003F4ED5A7
MIPAIPSLTNLDEQKSCDGYKRIVKPPLDKKLYTNTNYSLQIAEYNFFEPRPQIYPETLQFIVHKEMELFSFTEINIKKRAITKDTMSITLSFEENRNSESETVWRGTLTRADIEERTREAALRGESSKHALDKYHSKLVERVKSIKPVLDDLKSQDLLTNQAFSTVTSAKTTEDQMRELLTIVRGWGCGNKNKVWGILKKHNEPVIKEIEKWN